MNFKRVLKTALSLMLVAILAVSMFACTPEQNEPEVEKVFENQLVNDRYRFSQGIPEGWDYTQGEGGTAIRNFFVGQKGEGWLLAKILPVGNENVVYTVYKYDCGSDIATTADWMANLMDKVDPNKGVAAYKFNDWFTEEADLVRDTYQMTSADYKTTRYIPQVEWFEVEYTFVNEGEDWKGSYHVAKSSEAGFFFLVTCEAKADAWEANKTTFADMLKDFSDIGRGGSKKDK